MAPLRRYLRITKYSVLECRIYLDNPALAESWLLNPRNPVLPRVIESVRPLVLPKLREENERSKSKAGKKKAVRDVVVKDDFEVSIFLTETSARHSLLTKRKVFRDTKKTVLQCTSQKLMGATNDTAIDIEDIIVVTREESDEDGTKLADLPEVESGASEVDSPIVDQNEKSHRSKRARATTENTTPESVAKRRKYDALVREMKPDDKKKLAMNTLYDGFSIHSRVLCLVVKQRDKKVKTSEMTAGQIMMEDWITSTQVPRQEDDAA